MKCIIFFLRAKLTESRKLPFNLIVSTEIVIILMCNAINIKYEQGALNSCLIIQAHSTYQYRCTVSQEFGHSL